MFLIRKVFAKVRNPAQFGLTIVAFNYICSKIIKMETIRPNSFKAWLLASRPKTLTAAAIPVMIGCSLAATHGSFQPVPAILCFLFAFIMPPKMKKGIIIASILAGCCGCCLLFYSGPIMIPIGIACLIFAFLYTTGPYPLAYHGWGDVLVMIFFGFVPVGCTFYVMNHDWNTSTTIASIISGLVIDTLLMVNNFRDREQDKISGKKTIIVRLGARSGPILYFLLGLIACWLCFYFITQGKLFAVILPQFYLIPHIITTVKMVRIHQGKELNKILGETSRNMFLFGVLLSLGLLV